MGNIQDLVKILLVYVLALVLKNPCAGCDYANTLHCLRVAHTPISKRKFVILYRCSSTTCTWYSLVPTRIAYPLE